MLQTDATPVVAWTHVRKLFPDGFEALRDVSLTVARGELLAILGTSGSGKTTLLKMVNRLVEPTTGSVAVDGVDVSRRDPIALRRSIGYVIQDVGLMPHLTVAENVGLVPRLKGQKRDECRARSEQTLSLVGMEPSRFADLYPQSLSGGQRQRVGVARALASEAELILMDEPFGALDPITRRELQDEFRGLQRRLGKTAILVTHDLREACRIADRLALVDRGRLVQDGAAADFVNHPSSEFVRQFFRDAEAVVSSEGGAAQ